MVMRCSLCKDPIHIDDEDYTFDGNTICPRCSKKHKDIERKLKRMAGF